MWSTWVPHGLHTGSRNHNPSTHIVTPEPQPLHHHRNITPSRHQRTASPGTTTPTSPPEPQPPPHHHHHIPRNHTPSASPSNHRHHIPGTTHPSTSRPEPITSPHHTETSPPHPTHNHLHRHPGTTTHLHTSSPRNHNHPTNPHTAGVRLSGCFRLTPGRTYAEFRSEYVHPEVSVGCPDKRTLSGAHRTFVRKDVEKARGNVRQLGVRMMERRVGVEGRQVEGVDK